MSRKARTIRTRKLRHFAKARLKHGHDAAPTHKLRSGRTGRGLKGREGSV